MYIILNKNDNFTFMDIINLITKKKDVLRIYTELTTDEKTLLTKIAQSQRFPIVRLELRKSGETSFISTALNHVYLETTADTMEQVKKRSGIFQMLEDKGLIHIDYKVFVTVKSDYIVYDHSDIFALLEQLVEQGKQRPEFLFDIPYIKRGKIVLTDQGKQIIDIIA